MSLDFECKGIENYWKRGKMEDWKDG